MNDGVLGLDEFEIKDPIEAVTGWVLEGVYRKKVWDFAAEGPIPILDIYQNLLAKPLSNPYATTASNTIYTNSMPHPNNSENFKLLIKNMNAEIQSIRDNLAQTNLNATAGKDILSHAEFKFWQPWAHFFCIDETLQKDLCERLTNLFLDNWYYKGIDVVRPALGYYGFFNFTSKKAYNIVRVPFGLGSVRGGEVPGKNHDYLDDDFVYKKVTGSGEYAAVDQTTYYPNHSSMHDYYNVATGSADFQEIYKNSYLDGVMTKILESKTKTGFGKY